MRRFLTIATFILASALSFTACRETEEFDDHANWKQRNTDFIAAIADSCDAFIEKGVSVDNAVPGQMFRLTSFKLDPSKEWSRTNGYVYCKVISKGDGTISPAYTDSVRMNYRVRLMATENYPDGEIVDQSYKTNSLDPAVNVPASYQVSSLIDGVATALMYMHTGDRWIVYLPYHLGYGTKDKTGIPGYSSLIFDINLTEIARTGTELSPR